MRAVSVYRKSPTGCSLAGDFYSFADKGCRFFLMDVQFSTGVGNSLLVELLR